jgi:hypothetical protein
LPLTTGVTGILPSANGGTGINNAGRTLTVNTNSGTIAYTSAATTLTVAATGSISGTNTGDQTATTVTNTPAGNIAATTVQSAINELDGEKSDIYLGTNTYTANTVASLSDVGKLVEMNITSTANTYTIAPQSSVSWISNTVINIVQRGSGPTSVVAGAGVTFLTQSPLILYPNQVAVFKRISSDLWYFWNGPAATVVPPTLGGTGLTAVASGDYLYGSGTDTWTNKNAFATSQTALMHFKAGTATAGTAPIKLTSGTNLTTAEAGALEYDGTVFYLSPANSTRYRVMLGLTGSVTQDVASISAQTTSSPSTITVTGAAVGDPVYVGASAITAGTIFTAQVTATNTVTVYITNPTSGALDPPNAVYSVRVIKTP